MVDVRELVAAGALLQRVDRVVQMGAADPARTGVVGWSYGGTLGLHLGLRSGWVGALVVGLVINLSTLFIDAEHSTLDPDNLKALLQAVGDSVPCVVRVPALDEIVIRGGF